MGKEVRGERMMSDIDEVLAELQRERKKNAELLERISALEAQIQDNERERKRKGTSANFINDNHNAQGNCLEAEERGNEKCKRQKIESTTGIVDDTKLTPKHKSNNLVSWMSMDETQFIPLGKSKDAESTLESKDTDDSDDEDERYDDHNEGRTSENLLVKPMIERIRDNIRRENANPSISQIDQDQQDQAKKNARFRCLSLEKPPKVAFCPKEVRGILESDTLGLKNAQSHTMRKIIVFASLGIRHGCDDMYELDYNHFSILGKGEPYKSPDNPGEHVLYENPGVNRKVFYPNLHNPALCPVKILEEEKSMRPSDASCPSCLFLCIKYGGRTRNIPQNKYVRQRMGRNKLKSFGPLICQMARLVTIRTGSFFFKALGITLLFMAGFSDDIVQRETKYRNLDLLQKYFRTDEDAKGEELFCVNSSPSTPANLVPQKPSSKTTAKMKGKKLMNFTNYTETMENSSKPNILYNHHNHHPLYSVTPPHPISPNIMMPIIYWPSPNNLYPSFPNYPPSNYSYHQSLNGNLNEGKYSSFGPQSHYIQGLRPCSSVLIPRQVEGLKRENVNNVHLEEGQSSSGSTEKK